MSILERFQITDPRCALVFMISFAFSQGAVSTYIGAMITTIEKRFNFNSVHMGILMGANDIGYLCTVIFVAYFGSRKHRQPLVLMLSAIGLWLSAVVYVLPYAIFGERYNVRTFTEKNYTQPDICDLTTKNASNFHLNQDNSTDISPSEKSISLTLMFFAGVITGVAATPFWNVGIAYLDDMAGPKQSGIYIGILFGVRALSPVIGFLFGSFMTTVNESLKLTVDKFLPGQKDRKWIGAWWLGWLILGFCMLINAPFLGLLNVKKKEETKTESVPENVELKQPEELVENETGSTKTAKVHFLKEILEIIKNTWTNKIYVALIIGVIFDILGNISLYVFFTKYLEFHFRTSAKLAGIFAAFALSGTRVVSSLISGIISKVVPMSIRNMNKFIALTNTISGIMFPFLLLFSCPSVSVFGLDAQSRSSVCSTGCNCQLKKLDPVCYNGTSYFSPCTTGCLSKINETVFGNCGCSNTMYAVKGYCEQMCPTTYYFLGTFFVIKVINSICSVQFMTVFMRLCDPKVKSVYLSTISFLFGIIGLIIPPLVGFLIDLTCVHRNTDSYGGKSNCILYNNDLLRYLIIGLSFIFQIPASACYIVAWIITPSKYAGLGQSIKTNRNQLAI